MKKSKGKHIIKDKDKNKRNILLLFFSVLLFFSLSYTIYHYYTIWKNDKDMKELANWVNDNNTIENTENQEIKNKNEGIIEKLNKLKKENNDLIGWLKIEDTNIDYPVVQTNNNNYYVNHNFKKDYSELGTIFLDMDCSITKPTSNFLIYGHRNKSDQMFETLTKYKKEDFYKKHKTFEFSTLEEVGEYKIISVFQSQIYYKNQDVFKFYFFKDAKNEEEFNYYIKNIKKLSMYEIEDTAVYGEQLITLTTCDYHVEDGRFVVVAKKIN